MTTTELDAILAPRIVNPPKILTLDIERIPGEASVPFWSLSDYKNRRIDHRHVVAWPRTICTAWRWYGARRVEFAAEWDTGPDAFLRTIHGLYDAADIVVGHNIDAFDTKHLRTAWRDLHLPPPSPARSVDTLKVARSQFGDESMTLDALCKRLGIGGKVDRYDPDLARSAVAGSVTAQRKLARYNRGDVAITEALYDHLRPWIKNHPNLGLYNDAEKCCTNCGSQDVRPSNWAETAQTLYAAYYCGNCKAWLRNSYIKRRVEMRPVR